MYLNRGGFNLRRHRRDRFSFVVLYLILIFGGVYLYSLIGVDEGDLITPPGIPTATATRSPQSFSEEAEKQFSAGQLEQAVEAYERAIEADPLRIEYRIRLARIQVYAGQAEAAVTTATDAILLDPNNSTAHAVHALALDWTGNYADASDAAVRAIQLDSNNALAHAYYAEILVDQQRWAQAGDEARHALTLDPNSMDAYRVYGYYLEATSNYEDAIQAYQSALKINPNLAFLYMQVGVNYRTLAVKADTLEEQERDFDLAIQYFQRASAINPLDVGPYLSIARTYVQMGQYGAASQYLEEALTINPADARVHGELGKVYFKALNYESAIIELKCAVDGCSTTEDTVDDEDGAPVFNIEPLELNSTNLETYFIYSSILAALSTPENPHCQRAHPLIAQIRAWVQQNDPENTIVLGILDENEAVCQIAEATATAAFLTGNVTPSPTPTGTPTP